MLSAPLTRQVASTRHRRNALSRQILFQMVQLLALFTVPVSASRLFSAIAGLAWAVRMELTAWCMSSLGRSEAIYRGDL